jgi:Flp pilus assembly protein CpaB
VSRRGRALGFAAAAALCAGLAASATGGSTEGELAGLGELRDVVVAGKPIPEGRPLGERTIAGALEVRRVPERFLPPDALTSPEQAVGRSPATTIPAEGYLLGSQLRSPRAEPRNPSRLPAGRRPVEIAVVGAGALAARPARPERRVDVVVTTEPGPGGGAGRTYVAAEAVGLLDLRTGADPGAGDPLTGVGGEAWTATLALTRDQALRLIHAESFARSVRLIGR